MRNRIKLHFVFMRFIFRYIVRCLNCHNHRTVFAVASEGPGTAVQRCLNEISDWRVSQMDPVQDEQSIYSFANVKVLSQHYACE